MNGGRKKCSGDQPCTNCVKFGRNCTYSTPAKKRGPAPGTVMKKKQKSASELGENVSSGSNRSDSRGESFTAGNPLSLDHFRETHPTPILSDSYLHKWTCDTFPPLQIQNGLYLPWIELYFEHINAQYPIFCKDWFMETYRDLPIFLLHVMYMMTLLTPGLKYPREAEEASLAHFGYCQVLQEEWMESPCIFSIIASYLLSFYCFLKPTSIMTGLTNVTLVARESVQIGLGELQLEPWVSKSGKVYSIEDHHVKVLVAVFFTLLYEQDWLLAYLRKLSFLLPDHNPAINAFEAGLSEYNFYYSSDLWKFDYELAEIARKVVMFIRDPPRLFHTDPHWLKGYNQLVDDMALWKSQLPSKMHDIGSTVNSAIPSRWKLEYSKVDIILLVVSHAKYYALQIFIHRPMFLHILSSAGNYEHLSVQKSVDAGRRIEHLMKILQELDVNFETLPPFFSMFMFYGAAVLCMSTQIYGKSQGLVDTVNTCIDHIEKCRFCPPLRAQNLRKWLQDPMSGIFEFGTAL